MNDNQSEPTITSTEIAKLIGKEHREVFHTIKCSLARLDIDFQRFVHLITDENLITKKIMILPKRECILSVTGCFQPRHRIAIIDYILNMKTTEPEIIDRKSKNKKTDECSKRPIADFLCSDMNVLWVNSDLHKVSKELFYHFYVKFCKSEIKNNPIDRVAFDKEMELYGYITHQKDGIEYWMEGE